MFLVDKGSELNERTILKIISSFETNEKPRLNRLWNYYQGKQEILRHMNVDPFKPNNKIVTNYCNAIVSTYLGYITGVPVTYSGNGIEKIKEVLNYNDCREEDSEFLRQALIFGKAFEINYIDEDSKQRFKVLDTRQCIPVYDTTINQELLYVIRYYPIDSAIDAEDGYKIEVYGTNSTRLYKSSQGFASCYFIEEIPNYFNQVPVTVFSLNSDQTSIFEQIISLQDSYNKLVSSEVNDFEAFCDCYLVLKDVHCDPEDLQLMKENRVLVMDAGGEASYLTKSISDTQIVDMLQRINDNIHKIANCPDFNDEKFLAQSGIAMRYKLTGFENQAAGIVCQMTKAIQKRIELICSILNITGDTWSEVEISFTRNLPVNTLEIAQMVNNLRGLVSDETLVAQLPFVNDISEEVRKIQKQKEKNRELYSFEVNE